MAVFTDATCKKKKSKKPKAKKINSALVHNGHDKMKCHAWQVGCRCPHVDGFGRKYQTK